VTAGISRAWRVAVTEWHASLRNRRAVVMSLLFVAVAALVMYGTIEIFAAMERELLTTLKLPVSDSPGSVSVALWKSQGFIRFVEHVSRGSLIFADIRGRHPILLAYALFIFKVAPLLTLIVSASRLADDLRSGSARYWLVRATRTEWSVGMFLGEALMLAVAMLAGALAAWGVTVFRLPGWDGAALLPGLLDWTIRAWVYSFAWLGIFVGISHIARSGGKATTLSILALLGACAWPVMLRNFAPDEGFLAGLVNLDAFVPSSVNALLWRRSPSALLQGVTHLVVLGFLYLSVGATLFRRRDV